MAYSCRYILHYVLMVIVLFKSVSKFAINLHTVIVINEMRAMKNKINFLSFNKLWEVIDDLKKGASITSLSKKYNVSKSTICRIKKKLRFYKTFCNKNI